MKKFLLIAILSIFLPLSYSYGDTITWANGDTYTGDVKNGLPHGQGTLTWTNGARYSGEWKDFKVKVQSTSDNFTDCEIVDLPFYDKEKLIPKGIDRKIP